MSRFANRPLRILDRIYDFLGGMSGLTDFHTDAGIQAVHDVSRQAEIETALGSELGFFINGVTQTHVGAEIERNTFDPYAQADTFNASRDEIGIWIVGAACRVDVGGSFVDAGVSVDLPTVPDAFAADMQVLVALFPDVMPLAIVANQPLCSDNARATIHTHLPFWLPQGSTVNLATESSANCIIRLEVFMWAGAKGARPPGVS